MQLTTIVASFLAVASSLAAQRQTWIVGPGGFATLQAAFDAPQVVPGDIVIVRPGTYTGAVLRKGLTVRAEGAVLSSFTFPPIPPTQLRIEAVPAPQHVVIVGLQLDEANILAVDCSALVHLDGVVAGQPANPNLYFLPAAVVTERCNWVSIVRLQANGRAVGFTDSNVAIDQCQIRSLDGYSGLGYRPGGGPGISALRSSLAISATSVQGGSWIAGTASCGGPGLSVTDSYVGITGDVSVRAGSALLACATPGVRFGGSGAMVVDPAAQIIGSNAPGIVGVTPVLRIVPSLIGSTFQLGGQSSGTITSQAGDLYAVLLGLPTPPRFVAVLDGALGLDVAGPLVAIAGGSISGGRSAPWSLTVPSLPALVGEVIGLQAVAGTAQLKLSNPLVRSLR